MNAHAPSCSSHDELIDTGIPVVILPPFPSGEGRPAKVISEPSASMDLRDSYADRSLNISGSMNFFSFANQCQFSE